MKSNKDWIKKLDNDSLNYLLKNKDKITKTPKKLNDKALDLIKNTKRIENEKEKNFKFQFFFSTYKNVFVTAIIIILVFSLTLINFIFKPFKNLNRTRLFSKIENFNGNANIIRKEKHIALNLNNKLKKGDIVNTGANSYVTIKIGKSSKININEKSEIKIILLNKKNNNEINKLYLSKGKIECSINLPTKNSILEIYTETSLFTITGTKFSIEIGSDKINLIVTEGKVTVTNNSTNFDNKTLNKIRKKDINIYELLYKVIENKIIVEKNTGISINKIAFEDLKNDLNILFNETLEQLNNPDLSPSEKKEISNNIINLSSKSKEIITIQDISQNGQKDSILGSENINNNMANNFYIKKMPFKNNITLNEKGTQITTDNENIYIASNKNKTIYCFDPKKVNLKWKFTDKSINNITTGIKYYKNNLIFGTPNSIFVLYKNGTQKIKKEISGGPIYWPSFLITNGNLLIPAFKSIYKYDGNSITLFKELNEANSQLYISEYSGNILYIDINQKNIKEVDINTKKVIRQSDEFKDRVFMSPLIFEKNIFVGDISGNLYKINYQLNDKALIIFNINTGIISNLIYYNNYLFFVGNNGFFYKVNINNYADSKIIAKVDKNPDKDKYFTKKLLSINNNIFYPSDTGKVFYYNTNNNKNGFIEIEENPGKFSLIGTPVKIGKRIFFVDIKTNIYYLTLTGI